MATKKLKKDIFMEAMDGMIIDYKDALGLRNYHIGHDERDTGDQYLSMEFTYPYTCGTIFYSPDFKKQLTEDPSHPELKRRVLHEMCHIITDPLYAKALNRHCSRSELEDERERTTDVIANAIFRLLTFI